jgi:putative DNA primase/helicase
MGAARVSSQQRFSRGATCPVCGGSDGDKRGGGTRCHGFLSDDGDFAHCSREEHGGGAPFNAESATYAHRLNGPCKCGVEHGPPKPRSANWQGEPNRIVAEYDYVDEAGELLFQALRYEDKSFRQRRPGPFGGTWIWSLKDVRRVLYRLPELIAADPSRPVLVVEGEKDCDNLRSKGLVATCNPMGAKKWKDEYTGVLTGRAVWIVPDHDKDGAAHAEQVAKSVAKVARSVKVLDLADLCRTLGLGELQEKGDASDFLKMGGTAEQLVAAFEAAPAYEIPRKGKAKPEGPRLNVVRGDEEDSSPPEPPEAKRPEIEITTQRHIVLEQTLEALAADPDTYRRGPFLVRVVRESQEISKLTTRSVMKNVAGLPKIIPMADPVIGTRLTKFADFYQWKKIGKDEERAVSAHPPDWLVKAVGALGHWPTIRRLMSVVECPFPRPDGSIVETPGYDADTSTLFMPAEPFPSVPDSPTRDDAKAAWDRLKHHVRQFPFLAEDDRVVYLAGMLNVIGRVAIEGPVMGVAVIGNKASTGKGLLVDAMTIPGIGRTAPTTNYPTEKEEANKVKVAIVLSGKPVVSFDNLEEGSMYGGSVIDSALTAHSIDERILGASKNTGDLEVRTTWFLNGNNLNPTKDAYRRWMVCNLVTEHERPEQRDDIEDKDLRKVITRHRGEIVRDALTILRAHAVAGWPNGGWAPAGSFEDWDRVVRGAVWFATGRDCLATQRKTADEAPDRLAKIALLQGWYEMDGGKAGQCGMTVVEALRELDRIPAGLETLRAALMQKSRGGKLPDPRIVGNMLRGLRNNLIGGYRLIEAGKKQGSVCWVVEHKENDRPESGESGESGESDSNPRTRDFSSNTYSFKFSKDGDAYRERQDRDSRDSPDSRVRSSSGSMTDDDWGDA